jgi:transcriptional regulator with XRE-family HTH domain
MGKKGISKQEQWIKLVSERLKEIRKEKGFSSYETFAIDNDLDRKQYWRVENGHNITVKTLMKILEIHKKDPSAFFKEIESKKK